MQTEKHSYVSCGGIDGIFACRCQDKCPSITIIRAFHFLFTILISMFLHVYIYIVLGFRCYKLSWFVFKVLMLNVAVLTRFLHLSKFSLSFGFVTDFSNTGDRARNSA